MTDNPRYQKIWFIVNNVPCGSVITYGEVARLAGMIGCARLVSVAQQAAPSELKLPWHRVINARGQISFPKASQCYEAQKQRLIAEGVEFSSERINLENYKMPNSIDAILWQQ